MSIAPGGHLSFSRVIFLLERAPSRRDKERFGYFQMLDRGLSVDFWDLSNLQRGENTSRHSSDDASLSTHHFNCRNEFRMALSKLCSSDLVITLVGTDASQMYDFFWLHRLWKRCNASFASMSAARTLGSVPTSEANSTARSHQRLYQQILQVPYKCPQFLKPLVQATLGVRALDFLWLGAETHNINPFLLGKRTHVHVFHSLDYDLVLEQRSREHKSRPVAVLLDTMGPLHPDGKENADLIWDHSPSTYFAGLRRNLAQLQAALGLQVEIAAHPRAESGSLDECYEPFMVHYGATADIVARSEIVVASSGTTSLGLAVALNKPILIINDSSWPAHVTLPAGDFARMMGVPTWSIEDTDPPNSIAPLSDTQRQLFISQYMKAPSCPDRPFWDLVLDTLVTL